MDLRGLIRHSYWTKLVTQKSHLASLAAALSRGEDKMFHTEHVSATLIGWNLEGSIDMERPAIKVGKLKQFGLAAKQRLGEPALTNHTGSLGIKAERDIVV